MERDVDTVERAERAMAEAGFDTGVPVDSADFAGGDGAAVEDAPVGYYRYHFWKSEDECREHENWVAATEDTGPMCVSLAEDTHAGGERFVRMLIRTMFGGTKSVVLLERDVWVVLGMRAPSGSKRPTRTHLLCAALRMYIDHEQERERALEDEFGALSIRTSASSASIASSDLVRSLPSSRLHESARMTVIPTTGCLSALAGNARPEQRDVPPRRRMREVAKADLWELARVFTRSKERSLCRALVDMERMLMPTSVHLDAVALLRSGDTRRGAGRKGATASRQTAADMREAWDGFLRAFGNEVRKDMCGAEDAARMLRASMPADQLAAVLRARRPSAVGSNTDSGKHRADEHELVHKLSELVANEWRYVRKLQRLVHGLAEPLLSFRAISAAEHATLFGQLPELLALHTEALSDMTGGRLDGLCDVVQGDGALDSAIARWLESGDLCVDTIVCALGRLAAHDGVLTYAHVLNDYAARMDVLSRIRTRPDAAAIVSLFESGHAVASVDCSDAAAEELHGTDSTRVQLSRTTSTLRRKASTSSTNTCENSHDGQCVPRETLSKESQSPVGPRLTVEDIMGAVFQQLMRYVLLLRDSAKSMAADDTRLAPMMAACRALEERCACLDMLKESADALQHLFRLQREVISNCPADLPHPSRVLLAKTAFWEVERGAIADDRRLALFLFNDVLVGCRKRSTGSTGAKSGRLERKALSSGVPRAPKYAFLFRAPAALVTLAPHDSAAVRAKSGKTARPHLLTLPACTEVLLPRAGGKLTALGELCESSGGAADCPVQSQMLLVRRRHEKCAILVDRLRSAQQQSLLSASAARVFARADGLPLSEALSMESSSCTEDSQQAVHTAFLHAYDSPEAYALQPARGKSRTVVLYVDGAAVTGSTISQATSGCEHADALVLVQAREGRFRVHVRARETIFASASCYSAPNEYVSSIDAAARVAAVVRTVARLHAMYPPLGADRDRMQRELVMRTVTPYTTGVLRKLRALFTLSPARPEIDAGVSVEADDEGIVDVDDNPRYMQTGAFGASTEQVFAPPSVNSASDAAPTLKPRKSIVGRVLGRLAAGGNGDTW